MRSQGCGWMKKTVEVFVKYILNDTLTSGKSSCCCCCCCCCCWCSELKSPSAALDDITTAAFLYSSPLSSPISSWVPAIFDCSSYDGTGDEDEGDTAAGEWGGDTSRVGGPVVESSAAESELWSCSYVGRSSFGFDVSMLREDLESL